jgi:hypothetical protein
MLATTVSIMAKGGTKPMPAAEAISKLGDRPLLLIISKDAPLGAYARQVANTAPTAEVIEMPRTHSGATLLKQDAQAYDDTVVTFFTQAKDFAPPARPVHPEPRR